MLRVCRGLALCIVFSLTARLDAAPLDGRPASDDVLYQFMPIAWRDSDGDEYRFGDFGGMTASLDYLERLGVTAVWMNPIFPSVAYHGYQHGPGDEVNERLGTEEEFLAFVAAAHARGIKVYVDFVVYGISTDCRWFRSAYGRPFSEYDDWLAFTNPPNTEYFGYDYPTWTGDTVDFIYWNLDNPDATDVIVGWCRRWLDPDGDGDPSDGVDGYRLDHVRAESPDGWGYHIDWWEQWKARLLDVNPDVFTFAEQAQWGTTGADLLSAHDAAMTKPFEFVAREAVISGLAEDLYGVTAWALWELPPGRTYVGIIGDHDVDRLGTIVWGDFEKGKLAAAILLTQPFPPIIYHGDEIGMQGYRRDYGGDANDIPVREPFKWNAVAGPPMSNYFVLHEEAYADRASQDNDGRSVEEQEFVPGSLLEEYKRLIAARKACPALRHGSYHAVSASSTHVWAFLRHDGAADETLLVVHNLDASPATISLDLSRWVIPDGSSTVYDILAETDLADLTEVNQAAYPVPMEGLGYRILDLHLFGTPGDWDGNGSVDLADYRQFTRCFMGPGAVPLTPGCTTFDFDGDADVDLRDFAEGQR